ncbi:MAG: copper chaperone PCu(A)C [Wenzhouxiangella sp.]
MASHGVVILQPGGKHLMLRQPKRVMRSGDVVDMVLVFESGEEQLIAVQVDTR